MDSKRLKLSPNEADCDSAVFSGVPHSIDATNGELSTCISSANDRSVTDNGADVFDSGIDADASVNQTVDWKSIIDVVKSAYKDASISEILDHCVQNMFSENPDSSRYQSSSNIDRSISQKVGTLFHKYIAKFYQTFDDPKNVNTVDEFVLNMLAELKNEPSGPIAYDRISQLDRDFSSIHKDFYPELVQFYNFVNKNKMTLYRIEYSISDKSCNVRGRCNALFRSEEADDQNLMLFDWTLSAFMHPGSVSLLRKTLQLNLYKYMLEKCEGKKIIKMRSVIFHKDIDKYHIIDIDDIDIHTHLN